MKIRKHIAFLHLIVFLSVKIIHGQTSEIAINQFMFWKLNPNPFAAHNPVQENLPIESISLNIVPLDTLNNQKVNLYKLDLLLTKDDIDTMNQQIKYWNGVGVWDMKTYKLSFINPDTLPNSGTLFLELSIPIFSKNGQICLLQSNVNCHEHYCHDEMLALYQRQSAVEWKIINVLHHATF